MSYKVKERVIDIRNTYELLTIDQRSANEALFNKIDEDQIGAISTEEVLSHFDQGIISIPRANHILLEDWILQVDGNGDGELNLQQFTIFMVLAINGGKSNSIQFRHWEHGLNKTSKEKMWLILNDPSYSLPAFIVGCCLILMIIVSIIGFCLDSYNVPQNPLGAQDTLVAQLGKGFEITSSLVFSLEFVLRLISTPHLAAFCFNISTLLDLCALIPFYLFVINDSDYWFANMLKVTKLARISRLFKLKIFSRWFNLFRVSASKSFIPMSMAALVCSIYVVIVSSTMFFIEKEDFDGTVYVNSLDNSESEFQSIPDACYWCLITITTVGYGDKVPQTILGKVLGVFTMFSGMLVLAIPISIFNLHFQNEYEDLIAKEQQLFHRKQDIACIKNELSNNQTNKETNTRRFSRKVSQFTQSIFRVGTQKSVRVVPETEGSSSIIQSSIEISSSMDQLQNKIESMDDLLLSTFSSRENYRGKHVSLIVQGVIFRHRRKLWAHIRVLERQHREKLVVYTMRKREQLLFQEDFESSLINAATKIQALFRGSKARIQAAS